ncbi:hypothetical protein [Streptomyces sp. Tue6028]|uniref:hypothetical protein n=1 Tax=Streptomyces sp. Tue6028 TaxID=2036037 RepID=UPI003D744ACD
MSEKRFGAEPAPEPDGLTVVHRFSSHEVVRVNLYIAGGFYRSVARASYETPDGRLAYDLFLWPQPDRSPSGWYWWDASRMKRRTYRGPGSVS